MRFDIVSTSSFTVPVFSTIARSSCMERTSGPWETSFSRGFDSSGRSRNFRMYFLSVGATSRNKSVSLIMYFWAVFVVMRRLYLTHGIRLNEIFHKNFIKNLFHCKNGHTRPSLRKQNLLLRRSYIVSTSTMFVSFAFPTGIPAIITTFSPFFASFCFNVTLLTKVIMSSTVLKYGTSIG